MPLAVLSLSGFSYDFKHVASYPIEADFILTDNLKNCYAVSGSRLDMLDKDGQFLFDYNGLKYDGIGNLDVTNPLKPIVYFSNFSTVVSLDNKLGLLGTLDLFQLGFDDVAAVASSSDDRIWLYDNTDFKLKKINSQGGVIQESEPMNLVLGQSISPAYILERNNLLYVSDLEKGIYTFDTYGTYLGLVQLNGLTRFQVVKEQIVYLEDDGIKTFNTKTFQHGEIELPPTESDPRSVSIRGDRLFVLTDKTLEVFSF